MSKSSQLITLSFSFSLSPDDINSIYMTDMKFTTTNKINQLFNWFEINIPSDKMIAFVLNDEI